MFVLKTLGEFTKPDPTLFDGPMKVLVSMTFGSRSHIKNVLEIGKTLQERGHAVSYMAIDPYLKFADGFNFTRHCVGPKGLEIDDHRGISEINQTPVNPFLDTVEALIENLPIIYRLTMEDILKVVDDTSPDVIVCDFFSPSCIDAAYHRKIPLITGFQTLDGPMLPPPYITGPLSYLPTSSDELSFPMRFYSSIIHPATIIPRFLVLNNKLNIQRAQFGIETTSFANVGNWDNSLKLYNTFIGFEAARPIEPSVRLVGPIMSDDFAPLTAELQSFLNTKQRVLYIAFGSGVILSEKDVQLLFQAAIQLIDRDRTDGVVWALGKTPRSMFSSIQDKGVCSYDLLDNMHPRIQFIDWAPQVAILSHKAVRVFLSHGGLESVFEAAYSGTPIMTMPFFGDQYRNARKVVEMGFGGYTDRFTHTTQSVYQGLDAMLTDSDGSIAKAILHWQAIARMNAKRKTEAANIVEEYVLTSRFCRQNPNVGKDGFPCEISHLIPGYSKMNPIIAYGADVFIFLLLLLLLTTIPLFLFVRSMARSFFIPRPDIVKKQQ
ncbi:hypothetical protein DSO57_1014346 [Entomophthora muscae]|uniref:Uncharacterized protein n=1 Tax=Entomophthora muscae TaxID=34485 RepID=A0ACC2T5D8_9FUNG|nr:hypothetical protein DSO57_1014346 [Entomophthora muscae]